MAKLPSNLERHATQRGRWIAYDAQGLAFRVLRALPGYAARPSHAAACDDSRAFRAETLGGVAAMVAASELPGYRVTPAQIVAEHDAEMAQLHREAAASI